MALFMRVVIKLIFTIAAKWPPCNSHKNNNNNNNTNNNNYNVWSHCEINANLVADFYVAKTETLCTSFTFIGELMTTHRNRYNFIPLIVIRNPKDMFQKKKNSTQCCCRCVALKMRPPKSRLKSAKTQESQFVFN